MSLLLQHWADNVAQLRPDSVAIVANNETMTYGELASLSNRIAQALVASNCKAGDRVCLLMPKSPLAIACILGIYKADCIYVPLDPANPVARLAKIVESCESRCLLTVGEMAEKVDSLFQFDELRSKNIIGWLDQHKAARSSPVQDFSMADVLLCEDKERTTTNTTDSPAHILFTSGSTGEPKGVVITHANVILFVRWAVKYFSMTPQDRVSGHSPLHFDLSMYDIFGAQAAGCQLHLVSNELSLLPHKLAQWMRDSQLTQWFSVPALLNYLCKFDAVKQDDFPAMKRLLWCGEVLPTPTLQYFMQKLPHVKFTNLYGPTETTIASSYYTVPQCPTDARQQIPIGRACPGEELLVLDDATLQPQPFGTEGGLYIRGGSLAKGYWRDADKTRAVFIKGPRIDGHEGLLYKTGDRAKKERDGLIYYLGRNDMQIKSRGYRIDLGEIEAALSTLDYVRESCIVAVPDDSFATFTICCAYVMPSATTTDPALTPVQLRTDLLKLVPNYMIPSQWHALARLPRNANGKIDRRLVKEMFTPNATAARRQA
ncbi:MAG: amino acid adenylation domain-containing protein [Pseudomonadota bacterium]